MSENIIDVSNISKSFGGRKVVDGLSLSVAKGEVFGLLGHNGAGKSTTIEMILGIKKPDQGSAHILGKDAVSARKEIFEKVGVQLQSSAYQAAIKVGEICEEFASLYNEPADYRNLLEQFGLLSLIKSPVMELSGGERQKLSVVLALIGFIAGDKTAGGSDITYIQSAFASLTAVGICCSAFMSIPIVMVDYRDKKILKHLYCSPASPARILAAALCRTTKSLNVATTILYFPMLFLSGATIPYELFPKGLQVVADVMPLGIGIDLMKAASMGQDMGGSLVNIIILAVITVVCSTVAVKTFRWE